MISYEIREIVDDSGWVDDKLVRIENGTFTHVSLEEAAAALNEHAALTARVAEMEAAIEIFAGAAENWPDTSTPDSHGLVTVHSGEGDCEFTVGDLRRAARAVAKK